MLRIKPKWRDSGCIMKRRKESDEIILTCQGFSKTQVTGSCWSISYKGDDGKRHLFMIECGLPQGANTILESYNDMKRMSDKIISNGLVKSCENILFLHPHIDHTGLLPIYNSSNLFNGHIYSSYENIEITKELLKDCFHIHKKNVQYLKTKGKKVNLIYKESDLYNCFEHMDYLEVGKRIKIDSNLEIELNNNSHTLGSCNAMIYVRKPSNNRIYKICYTSDMGSGINKNYSNYLKEQNIPTKCNVFISEATYSDKYREMNEEIIKTERKEFIQRIKEGLENGGEVLLPVFAFSRSQQVLTVLYNELKNENWFNNNDYEVICDGLLMNNINKCYSRVLKGEDKKLFDEVISWNRLKKIETFDGTMAMMSKRKPRIILASSGFLENGKVCFYMPLILGSSKGTIIITGYCSQNNEGSVGWKLVNSNQKTITFPDKQTVLKRAKVYQQKSWSSHITNKELKELFSKINCDKIIVHHCDENNKEEFINDCKNYLMNKNKTTKIVATGKSCYQFVL